MNLIMHRGGEEDAYGGHEGGAPGYSQVGTVADDEIVLAGGTECAISCIGDVDDVVEFTQDGGDLLATTEILVPKQCGIVVG